MFCFEIHTTLISSLARSSQWFVYLLFVRIMQPPIRGIEQMAQTNYPNNERMTASVHWEAELWGEWNCDCDCDCQCSVWVIVSVNVELLNGKVVLANPKRRCAPKNNNWKESKVVIVTENKRIQKVHTSIHM